MGFTDEEHAAVQMARTVKKSAAALVAAVAGQVRDAGGAKPGLRPAHSRLFEHLDTDGTRLTALADRAGMSHQAMGELVTELVAAGYLERVPDPADGRARLVRPTAAGRGELARATGALRDLRARWQAELGDERSVDDILDGLAALIRVCTRE
jgi:DNA-binding MarR family transcriptional regulator